MRTFMKRNNISWSKFIFMPIYLLTLQSCSNTEIGQRLANSFEPESVASPKIRISKEKINKRKVNEERGKETNAKIKIINRTGLSTDGDINNLVNKKPIKINKKPINKKIAPSFVPQPYRITIKLSGANPSEPAQTVTRALIKAGVQFEVERIERINSQKSIKVSPLGGARR